MKQARIQLFSDLLCVWAYIGQRRLDQLVDDLGPQVQVDHHFLTVFGDVATKVEASWANRGGLAGYNAHVQEVARRFPELTIHEECWTRAAPTSCVPAHLYACAVRRLESDRVVAAGTLDRVLHRLRSAFFEQAQTISDRAVLDAVAEELSVPVDAVDQRLADGRAHAEWAKDLKLGQDLQVRMSPTWVLNDGRQRLQGNVGYRVIEANVRELLDTPDHGASWC